MKHERLTTRDGGTDDEKRDRDSVLGENVDSPSEEQLGGGSDDRL